MGTYKDNNGWRKRNTKLRNGQRRRNYLASRKNGEERSMKHWPPEELELIFHKKRPSDRELSQILGRSVQAIQSARLRWQNRLRKSR